MKNKLSFLLLSFALFISCGKVSKDIDPVKVPVCTITGYNEISAAENNKYAYNFTYNSDNKIIAYDIIATDLKTNKTSTLNYSFKEDKTNLGSTTLPYLIKLVNNELYSKYYCEKDGRVNKVEYYNSPTDKFPSTTVFEEYDASGANIKTTYKDQNDLTGAFTGDYYVYDAVYINGNYTKTYYSVYENNVISQVKYVLDEYTASTNEVKTTFDYLFNYGTLSYGDGNKFYADTKVAYNPDGSILNKGKYVYKFNTDGTLLSQELSNTDGSKTSSADYIYLCK